MAGSPHDRSHGIAWMRLALVLAGLMVGGVLAEGLLRWFRPDLVFQFSTAPPSEDDIVMRRGQTNRASGPNGHTFTFDADGYRIGSGLSYDRTVLFLGDSFTRGEGVDDNETFARVTEDRLRQRGLRVRGLNTGAQGFGAAHELRVLRSTLVRTRIDAIVLQIFPYNDLSDNWEDGGFGMEHDQLVEYSPHRRPAICRMRKFLCKDSPLRNLLLFRALANLIVPADFFTSPDDDAAFDLERGLLAATVETARQHQVPIVLMLVPTSWIVSKDPLPEHTVDRMRFERFLAIAQRLGAPLLDLRNVTRDTQQDFIPGDGHFSARGNALTGEALAELLAPLLEHRSY